LGFAAESSPQELVIATKESPPFSYQSPDGAWTGLGIELWEEIAAENNWKFRYQSMEMEAMLTALEAGTVDVAVAPLSITSSREERIDFSHPVFRSGLALALPAETSPGWLQGLKSLFSTAFLKAILALLTVLLMAGAAVWLFERKSNPEQFGGSWPAGLGAGFWWSAVTMTTVGYGDKAPVSVGGRVVALIWMFASIITISGFTAAIATAITVGSLGQVADNKPLKEMTTAVVAGSSASDFATRQRVAHRDYPTLEAALRSVVAGNEDAILYDRPILNYLIGEQEDAAGLALRPGTLTTERYAFGLPENSPLQERLNQALLRAQRSTFWGDVKFRYLGTE
jgi:ABC-type amino acid transport substrate-binding protein